MENWTVDEVCQFLRRNDFEENVIQAFRVNKVRGRVLPLLNDEDLKQLEVIALGDRKYLQHLLARVCREEIQDNDLNKHPVTAKENNKVPVIEKNIVVSDEEDGPPELIMITTPDTYDYKYEVTSEDDYQDDEYRAKRMKLDPTIAVISVGENDYENQAVGGVKKQQMQECPLPIPFELPTNFQQKIMIGLEEQQLVGRARAKFITAIAEAMFRFKSYPTREEYQHVAMQIIKKWEFLGRQTGHDYFVEVLMARMAYLRKPDGQKRGKPASPRIMKQKYQMPTFPAFIPSPGEDRTTHDGFVTALQHECKSVHPRKQVLRELMNRTFSFRRQDLLSHLTIHDLLSTYPPLQDPEELACEFNRIMGRDVVADINCIWQTAFPKIISIAKEEGIENHYISNMITGLPMDMPDDDLQVLAICLLYLLLPDTRTKVDLSRIITFIKEDEDIEEILPNIQVTQPCVVVRGQLGQGIHETVLVVDKQQIATFQPMNIPLVLLSAFYGYNMHYTEGCTNFYSALETLFLRRKKPARKTRLSAFLSRLARSYQF